MRLKRLNYIITIFSLFAVLFAPHLAYAQTPITGTISSNRVCTKVGTTEEENPCRTGGVCTKTPPPAGTFREAIRADFNIIMNGGFNENELRWAWEQFCAVSSTNFIQLVSGVTVQFDTTSWQENNNLVHIQRLGEENFKVVLIHELGHIIKWRTDLYTVELKQAIAAEGYLTNYSANAEAFTGSDNFNEDYAEMITYYLNPNSRSQTAKRSSGPNPYAGGAHPLHYNIARNILGPF